ncbi:hypothetical protein L4174_019620 [Photobacterium sp. CCB-ST2H9]|uniref:hypothetical protein n=1 Tax=Photobacterium sp. CCB-ST2H9 TaxID=2912855 RepID=UPI002002A823|nr:hypothetical protein [Photobacterium sp. CCB-ST2H9]UTM60266.1 hypothetical protein L4174_019620 [Photobacterium sp. CCB-ST2H9]
MSHTLQFKTWSVPFKLILAFGLGFAAIEWLPGLVTQSSEFDSALACQLSQQHCQQQDAVIQMSDDIVRPLQPTTITVQWPQLPAETKALRLTLEGREMMMGQYQLQLTRQPDNSFSGELLLPFCTENAMTWQGSITPDSGSFSPLYVSLRMTQ